MTAVHDQAYKVLESLGSKIMSAIKGVIRTCDEEKFGFQASALDFAKDPREIVHGIR